MKRSLSFLAILLIFLAACSPAASTKEAVQGKEAAKPAAKTQAAPAAAVLLREAFPSYSASFVIDFDGAARWKYQLQTRKSSKLVETNLHIEGISGAQNPGDIRLVTDGVTSWMTGPATDNECVQFPNNSGMDPSYLYPESLVALDILPGLVKMVREETYVGKPSQYFSGGPVSVGAWKDARLEFRQEKSGKGLLQFAMLASGDDPAFGSGPGTIIATYTIDSLEEPVIEPVSGCEISVPLPASAVNYVRLPGLSSFDSPEAAEQIGAFYQGQLPAAGWAEAEPPAQVSGTTVLSYQRGAEQVEIQIEPVDAGSQVKLIFLQ